MTVKNKETAEDLAEQTGELVGKGVKKGWGVVKAFGKGVVDTVSENEKKKKK